MRSHAKNLRGTNHTPALVHGQQQHPGSPPGQQLNRVEDHVMSYFDSQGRERPNPQPVEIPLHMRREVSIDEKMKQIIRTQMSIEAARNQQETFEEANDFDIDDDDEDILTPYEVMDMRLERIDPDATTPLQNGVAPKGAGAVDPPPKSEVPVVSHPEKPVTE